MNDRLLAVLTTLVMMTCISCSTTPERPHQEMDTESTKEYIERVIAAEKESNRHYREKHQAREETFRR